MTPFGASLLMALSFSQDSYVAAYRLTGLSFQKTYRRRQLRRSTLMTSVNDSNKRIWNGDEVAKTTVEGVDEVSEIVPFPAMVALVWKELKDPTKMLTCGGTLFMRRYIITAAHCLANPSEWQLHAYLNPYANPLVVEQKFASYGQEDKLRSLLKISSLRREWLEHGNVYTETPGEVVRLEGDSFFSDVQHGLGTLLPDMQDFLVHKNYEIYNASLNTKGIADIAIIQLKEAPFVENSLAWQLFEVSIPDAPPDGDSSVTVFGNGLVEPAAQNCVMNAAEKTNCNLMTKPLTILSQEGCLNSVLVRAQNFAEIFIGVAVEQRAKELGQQVEKLQPTYDVMTQFLQFTDKRARALQGKLVAVAKTAARKMSSGEVPAASDTEEAGSTNSAMHALHDLYSKGAAALHNMIMRFQSLRGGAALSKSLEEPPTNGTLEQYEDYLKKIRELRDIFLQRELAVYDMIGVRDGRTLCGFSETGNVQPGDSGGPMVNTGTNELVGITSRVTQTKEGNILEHEGRGSFEGKRRLTRMPSFFNSAARYKTQILAAVECLDQGLDGCSFG